MSKGAIDFDIEKVPLNINVSSFFDPETDKHVLQCRFNNPRDQLDYNLAGYFLLNDSGSGSPCILENHPIRLIEKGKEQHFGPEAVARVLEDQPYLIKIFVIMAKEEALRLTYPDIPESAFPSVTLH